MRQLLVLTIWINLQGIMLRKGDLKGGLIYHFIHMTFLKLQNHRNEEQIGGYQRRGEEGVVIKG